MTTESALSESALSGVRFQEKGYETSQRKLMQKSEVQDGERFPRLLRNRLGMKGKARETVPLEQTNRL